MDQNTREQTAIELRDSGFNTAQIQEVLYDLEEAEWEEQEIREWQESCGL